MASKLGRIPATWWFKSAAAGVVGGLAMALSWNIGSALAGRGFWTPLNTVGTTMPGGDTIATTFGAYTITGAFLHLLTSMCWGVVFGAFLGLVLPHFARNRGRSILAGLGFGVGVFVIMGLIVGPLLNPAIMSINWVNYFIGHLVFGAVTGLSLYVMARRRELAVTFAPGVPVTDRQANLRR
jgi:hypothetical protein